MPNTTAVVLTTPLTVGHVMRPASSSAPLSRLPDGGGGESSAASGCACAPGEARAAASRFCPALSACSRSSSESAAGGASASAAAAGGAAGGEAGGGGGDFCAQRQQKGWGGAAARKPRTGTESGVSLPFFSRDSLPAIATATPPPPKRAGRRRHGCRLAPAAAAGRAAPRAKRDGNTGA